MGGCLNSKGAYPTRWQGMPTDNTVRGCSKICETLGAAKCTGFARQASNGYCEVFGKALPTDKEERPAVLDGFEYNARITDDTLTKTSVLPEKYKAGVLCFPRAYSYS